MLFGRCLSAFLHCWPVCEGGHSGMAVWVEEKVLPPACPGPAQGRLEWCCLHCPRVAPVVRGFSLGPGPPPRLPGSRPGLGGGCGASPVCLLG